MIVEDTIHVSVREGYDVIIGKDLLVNTGKYLSAMFQERKAFVITDSNVKDHYLNTVLESLKDSGIDARFFVFPAGEGNKNLATYESILNMLAENHCTRSDYIIALGGGVCGDMAGFAAGTYMRGIPFVQIPTTVLAMVDSSVGGKCAVDLCQGKNLVGVFHQPSLVLCDTNTLSTLPQKYFKDGMAEVVKTGILCGGELFDLCCNFDIENLPKIISMCVEYKAGVVERDETEQGERKLLNLGHTAAHAIERCSQYTVPHGHAVAIGTSIIARASDRLGFSSTPISDDILSVLSSFGLPTSTEYSPEELLLASRMDKKSQGNEISVIIPEKIGHCVIRSIDFDVLSTIYEAGIS